MKIEQLAYALIIVIAIAVILIYLQSILVPFVFSVIVWLLIRELKGQLNRIPYVKSKFPKWLKNLMAFVFIIGTIVLLVQVLAKNIEAIYESSASYKVNAKIIIGHVNDMLGIDLLREINSFYKSLDMPGLASNVLNSISVMLGNIFLVIIYVVFLMIEEATIPRKLKMAYKNPEKLASARKLLSEINHSVSRYISLKTIVSLITGISSYIALLIIGVDFPLFWAAIIFFLNFIPTIGSLIATFFPALMALLQFVDFTMFILVLAVVGVIQLLVGNFLEPKLLGNSLNISSLVVLVSLAFWGVIWGVVGMVLSVPITVILIIVFSRFNRTRNLAIWLSGNGKID